MEDDDGSIGVPSRKYGIRLPNFSLEDQRYLDEAPNHTEFIARLTRLANSKDNQHKREHSGAQTADDYIESLRRAPKDLSGTTYDGKGTSTADDYMESLNVRVTPDMSGVDGSNLGINSAEKYIQDLARGKMEKEEEVSQDTREAVERVQGLQELLREREGVTAAELNEEPELDMAKIDRDIADLEHSLKKTMQETGETGAPLDENIKELEEKIARMQTDGVDKSVDSPQTSGNDEIDAASTDTTAVEEDPEMHAMEKNVEGLDKQINFMEQYLERLQREQAAESAAGEDSGKKEGLSVDEVMEMRNRFGTKLNEMEQSVGNLPQKIGGPGFRGDMTEAERMEAFQAIRMQAMKQRAAGVNEFMDPLAKPLPERKSDLQGYGYGEDEEEVGDEETQGKERISNAYFVVSEVEAEIKKYLFDAKSLLREHEDKMKFLLQKLKELE